MKSFKPGDRVQHKDGLVMTVITSNEVTTYAHREPKDIETDQWGTHDKWLVSTENLKLIEQKPASNQLTLL